MNRTKNFYRDVLGIMLQETPGDNEHGSMIASLNSGLELVFFEHNATTGHSPVIVFGLEEGHIDKVTEEIAKKGVEIVTPVSKSPGGWSVDFADPDGHLLSFYQTEDLPKS